ncbi:MAG: ABC transporter ATP-binding protein [Streptosporangiales bacterium]
MLHLASLTAFYGKSQVLRGVSLDVAEGEVVAMLGRNGAGKTTTLKSVMGIETERGGVIEFHGRDLRRMSPFEIARLGIGYVPEHRGIFAKLSVEQNLQIALRKGSSYSLDDVYAIFPSIASRRRHWGFQLSGGEQQMLAIARALVTGPRLVLLDEPSQGLAPVVLHEVVRVIGEVQRTGVAVLLVEQNLDLCQRVAERFYILDSGTTVYEGDSAEFAAADDVRTKYLTLDVGGRHG